MCRFETCPYGSLVGGGEIVERSLFRVEWRVVVGCCVRRVEIIGRGVVVVVGRLAFVGSVGDGSEGWVARGQFAVGVLA